MSGTRPWADREPACGDGPRFPIIRRKRNLANNMGRYVTDAESETRARPRPGTRQLVVRVAPRTFVRFANMWKSWWAVSIAVVFGAFGASEAFSADVFAGRAIYEMHCVTCHGFDGRPLIPGSPDFTRGERLLNPDALLIGSIRTGKDLMPSFDRIINEQDMLDVLVYIRTLYR